MPNVSRNASNDHQHAVGSGVFRIPCGHLMENTNDKVQRVAAACDRPCVEFFAVRCARVLTLRMTGLDIPPDHASSVPPLPAPTAYRSTPQSDATLKQFESSVLKFIVLHEIGHMVADTYAADAPMIGNPEDAADRFAAFVLTRNNDDPDVARRRQANAVSSQILLSARAYWRGRYRLEQGNERQPLEFGDTHLLNPQRAELIGCLLYGSNPDDYAALADELGMIRTAERPAGSRA